MPRPYDASVRITGDSATATRWVTFAYNLLDQAENAYGAGADFRTTRALLDGGAFVFIIVGSVAGIRTVHIHAEPPCEIALESGLVDLLGIGMEDPLTFQPGRVHVGASVAGYTGTTVGNETYSLTGTLDAFGAQLAGQKPDGETSEAFSAEGDESNYLAQKKRAAYYFPPSMLTGKARLWLQAVYGSKANPQEGDVFPYVVSEGGVPVLTYFRTENGTTRTVAISPGPLQTTGIYTNDQYEYFLLNITSSTIQIYPMLQLCGEGIRQLLVEYGETLSFEDRCRLESYLLAGCEIDLDGLDTKANPAGAITPLAYGWKFSWSGKNLAVVNWEYDRLGNYDQAFKTTLYTLSLLRRFLEDDTIAEADRWQVIFTSRAPEYFQVRPATDPIWRPNWASKELDLWWLPGVGQIHDITYRTGSGAYYCFYEQNETLKEIRFSLSPSTTMGSSVKEPECVFGERGVFGIGPNFTATETVFGSGTMMQVSNDTYSTASVSNTTAGQTTYKTSGVVSTDSPQGTNLNPRCGGTCADVYTNCEEAVAIMEETFASYPPDMPPPWYGFNLTHYDRCNYTITSYSGSGSYGGQIASVIPFYDAEAHYTFHRSESIIINGTKKVWNQGSGSLGGPRRCTEYYWFRILNGAGPNYMYPPAPQTYTYMGVAFDLVEVESEEVINNYTSGSTFSGLLRTPRGLETVDMGQINTGQLFAPSLLNPVLPDTYDTRVSVLGDVKGKGIDLITGYSIAAPLRFVFEGWV